MNRRHAAMAGGLTSVLLLTASCGEPGLPTRGIALEAPDGTGREISVSACSPVTRVDFSEGHDMYGSSVVSVKFDGSTKDVRVSLDPAEADQYTYLKGTAKDLSSMRAPFAVRIKGTNGDASLTTVFEKEPTAGHALTILKNGDASNTEVPIESLKLAPDCTFDPNN